MRASYRWLKSLVPGLEDAPAALAARLSHAGVAVDAIEEYGAAAAVCAVAVVVSSKPHPSKSGLKLVTVDRGGSSEEVVCGAPNVPDAGGLVVLAPLGAHLPAKGVVIERRMIAGVPSEGMLCSESELGLSESGGGILVLPAGSATPGQTLAAAFPEAHDHVFEIDLTPNRPDCLGHVGLAREISALCKLPFAYPALEAAAADGASLQSAGVSVEVLEPTRCPHYALALVRGVSIRPSALGVQWRLGALGVRAISNVVDVTNIAMLLWGHPMHAFDLSRVAKRAISVRRARAGEALTTLDGVERKLEQDDLLICDGEGPVALAGVMGGASSEINPQTTDVLFECAYFEPRGVRRTARRHGMHTESSHRFERGVDPGGVRRVLSYAAGLTVQACPSARTAPGDIHAAATVRFPPRVTLRRQRMDALLGMAVGWSDARGILERLGFIAGPGDEKEAQFGVPTHRPDCSREVDLIDEVIRVHGIDKLPATLPAIQPSRPVGGGEELARRARAAATELGLSEAVTYAFTSRGELSLARAPEPVVVLKNPIVEHHEVMRTSLCPGLFAAARRARNHGVRDAALFTIGSVYLASKSGGLPNERMGLTALIVGERPAYLSKPSPVDVLDAKGLAVGLVERLIGRAPVIRREPIDHLHPRGSAGIYVDNTRIGVLGPLHPDVLEGAELGDHAVIVELELDLLGEPVVTKFRALPRFPASTRDLALVVHDDVLAGDVLSAVQGAAGALAEDVTLFDRFAGGALPADHHSLAFHVVYRAPDRTLTDADVDQVHGRVVAAVGERFKATLRQ